MRLRTGRREVPSPASKTLECRSGRALYIGLLCDGCASERRRWAQLDEARVAPTRRALRRNGARLAPRNCASPLDVDQAIPCRWMPIHVALAVPNSRVLLDEALLDGALAVSNKIILVADVGANGVTSSPRHAKIRIRILESPHHQI